MTEEQKDILIAKMLDAPSLLTDKELDAILSDEELRDIYEMSAAVSGAYIDQPDFDVANEWDLFRHKIRRKPMRMFWAMRIAAIFLGVVFVSGIIVRIIDKVHDEPKTTIAKVQEEKKSAEINTTEEDVKSDEIPKKEDSGSVIKGNNTASSPLQSKTNANITRQTEQSETENPDIDEYLRLQQARIDNDLAMMTAEAYLYEYDEFLQDIEDIESFDTTELENAIRQVTIQ